MNFNTQYYKSIPLNLINRKYDNLKAKRFIVNHTNQNVWIPNKHLQEDGTIIPGEDIDYVFRKAQRQLELSGVYMPIPGIKRRTEVKHEQRRE